MSRNTKEIKRSSTHQRKQMANHDGLQIGQSPMGVFYSSSGGLPHFLDFDPSATPANGPFPGQCNGFCSSTSGLLLCHHPDSDHHVYSVTNPFRQGAVRRIRNPSDNHPEGTARILVVREKPNITYGSSIFNIVCAVPLDDGLGYKFDIYCSRTDSWTSNGSTRPILEKIRPESGVPFGEWACWLTPMSKVVFYNLDNSKNGALALTEDLPFHTPQLGDQRQLAVMPSMSKPQEKSLFLIVKNAGQVRAYEWIKMPQWESTMGQWKEQAQLQLSQGDEECIPLCSQSNKVQILAGKGSGFALWEPLRLEQGRPHPSILHRRSWFALGGQESPASTHALLHVRSDFLPDRDFPLSPRPLRIWHTVC